MENMGENRMICCKVDPYFHKYLTMAAERKGWSMSKLMRRHLQAVVNQEIRESYSDKVLEKLGECELNGLIERMDEVTEE